MIISNLFTLAAATSTICKAQPIPSSEHGHHSAGRKRSVNTCAFPTDLGLVPVQTTGKNGGWALPWDTACTSGNYCPYACQPGQLMAQWSPQSTSYTYPESQYGGLKCNDDGSVSKPYPNKDYCVEGKGTLQVNNLAGSDIAFCQTVLPGNEEMLIPTNVGSSGELTTLAVPGTDYWASTAAHYYVNPPGVSVEDGCKWGTTAQPWGNWSPYVAGANMDNNQNTYVKIGWNPKYLDDFGSTTPNFGVRITCDDESKCNGLHCEIDPTQGINHVSGPSTSTGAGNADFCVVTAEQGTTAKIEVFLTSDKKIKRDSDPVYKRDISRLFDDPGVEYVN